MSKPNLNAENINSPIQLMAAWFVMLILLSGVLLAAASQIEKPEWAAGYLVISTSILILIVLACVILMLTKYRPNLQEGKEYAEWLKDQNIYTKVASPAAPSNSQLENLRRRIRDLRENAVPNDENINSINEIEDSDLYSVSVSDTEGSQKIISSMKKLGVEASIYGSSRDSGTSPSDHEAIWLGSEVPVSLAQEIIKKSVQIWPHLKYIFLSEDSAGPEETHWEVYIGGATSTAIEEGLTPWSVDEINNLQSKTTGELHAEIRKRYP